MNDRELLEMAARAAGKGPIISNDGRMVVLGPNSMQRMWAPLDDDGDALRLAVSIPVCIVIDGDMKWCGVHLNGNRGKYDLVEPLSGDPAAATRRAIVRAAAAIGDGME